MILEYALAPLKMNSRILISIGSEAVKGKCQLLSFLCGSFLGFQVELFLRCQVELV